MGVSRYGVGRRWQIPWGSLVSLSADLQAITEVLNIP